MKRDPMKYIHPDRAKPFHFFASSVGEWRVDSDLEALVEQMKKSGLMFNLFYVPLPKDAPYEINYYCPKVEGAIHLGYWEQTP